MELTAKRRRLRYLECNVVCWCVAIDLEEGGYLSTKKHDVTS